tara:strand:+ start:109 stop:1017 length:909 start_codon:yes stop_codon:yes gene_type:complete
MSLFDKKVLVTGHTGLIGTVVVRMLEGVGAKVTGYDISEGRDIMDLNMLIEHVKGKDVVIHLAADSGVAHSKEIGYDAWKVNFWGTLNVLEACRYEPKLQAVLTASTNHLYGMAENYPTAETEPFLKLDTYTATKAALDVASRSYAYDFNVPVAVIRNTNCFGPNDPHFDHIIPGSIRNILKNQRPVIRSDGKKWKSYLYVDDVASAYLKVAEWVIDTKQYGEAFNVSTDETFTPVEVVFALLNSMGSDLKPVIEGAPNDDANEKLDWKKINKLTGWEPQFTLAEGIALTVAGFKAREEVFA